MMDIGDVNRAESLLDGLQYLPDWGPRVLAVAKAIAAERAVAHSAIAVMSSDRDAAEAKLEKIAILVADLRFATGAEWVARMLDNILFPCECPGEHCGECGCCPDEDDR